MSIIRCEHCERPVDTDLKPSYEICEQCVDKLSADFALAEHLDKTIAVAADAVNRATQAETISAKLLGSLEAVVKWMDDSNHSSTRTGGVAPFTYGGTEYSVVTDARAAIAKAKGE